MSRSQNHRNRRSNPNYYNNQDQAHPQISDNNIEEQKTNQNPRVNQFQDHSQISINQLNPEEIREEQKTDERRKNNGNDREVIKSRFQMVRDELNKNIDFYKYLLNVDTNKLCLRLSDILTYSSLPSLKENKDLIIFLKFIQRMIQAIGLKNSTDLESTQKQLQLMNNAIFGFLEQDELQKSISYRFHQNSGKKLKSKYNLNSSEYEEFMSVMKDIAEYCFQNNKDYFGNFHNQLGIFYFPEDDIRFYSSLLSQEKKVILQKLEQTLGNSTLPITKDSAQLFTLLSFVKQLIMLVDQNDDEEQKNNNELVAPCEIELDSGDFKIIKKSILNYLKMESFQQKIKDFASNDSSAEPANIQRLLDYITMFLNYSFIDNVARKKYEQIQFDLYDIFYDKEQDFEKQEVEERKQEELIRQQQEQEQVIENQKNYEDDVDKVVYDIIFGEKKITEDMTNYDAEIHTTTNTVPNEEDCKIARNYRGDLKRLNLKKVYADKYEYLKTMFSFLRADSHQELVIGMNAAIELGRTKFDINQDISDQINIFKPLNGQFHFYNNIDLVHMEYHQGLTMVLLIQPVLAKKNLKLNFEFSKRLLGDQYVYLTDYQFQRLYICQLQNEFVSQEIKQLNQEHYLLRIKLKVIEESNQDYFSMKDIQSIITEKRAIIIEPKLYYGQYFSCMTAIKQMIVQKHNIPFQNNILKLEKKITLPAFIDEMTEYELDFTPLTQNNEEQEQINAGFKQNLFGDWRNVPTLKYLNNSQVDAIKNILTKEISIIQGPPGTGKTYVGAIAIRNILKNSSVWNPNNNIILMCCKTNHALDQFLGYIMKFETSIARIGSRSKVEEIKQYQLDKLRKQYAIQNASYHPKQLTEDRLNKSLTHLSKQLFDATSYEEVISFLPSEILYECCRKYLLQFSQVLPFIYHQIEQILSDYYLLKLVKRFWWEFNPDVNSLSSQLFEPLIDKYCFGELEKQNIKTHFYTYLRYHYSIQSEVQNLYLQNYYLGKKQCVNYFFKDSQDDTVEATIQDYMKDHQKRVALWFKVLSTRNSVLMQKQESQNGSGKGNDDGQDEDEYAEDRENFVIDDDGAYEEEDEENAQKKQKKQKKKKRDLSDKILYLTYYQLMNVNIENQYQRIEAVLNDDMNYVPDFQEQLIIRMYAIIKHSEKHEIARVNNDEMTKYQDIVQRLSQEQIYSDIQILKKKKIVAMTLGGISKYSEYLKYLNYGILIVEEAAEVLENLSVPLLQPFLKQLILIGDHKQLKPAVNSYTMEKEYGMNVSLFQRLVSNRLDYVCLKEQMRMCPEFSNYVRLIYDQPNQYQDSQRVINYDRRVRGLPTNIMFFMHNFEEMQLNYTTTKKNEQEADYAISFAKYLINQKQYTSDQITILAMYLGQAFLIRKLCQTDKDLLPIRVSTIDNYQGEENEIIILSLVRSDPNNLGYVKVSNRINVSISRAKKGFIILGNQKLLNTPNKLWSDIFELAKRQNHIYIKEFSVKCPQHKTMLKLSSPKSLKENYGGCEKICKIQNLSCSHQCKKKCHGGSCDEQGCEEIVEAVFPKCKHINKIRCSDRKKPNLKCTTLIEVESDICNHIQKVECHRFCEETNKLRDEYENEFIEQSCKQICNRQLDCGHLCKQNCHQLESEYCDVTKCKERSSTPLLCGHLFKGECGKKMLYKCLEKVAKKTLPCGHFMKDVVCSMVQKCKQKCTKTLPCGHQCEKEWCYEAHTCSQKSNRLLPCGHKLYELCQADLTNYKCDEMSKKPLVCGHGKNTNICCEEDLFECQKEIEVKLYCGHTAHVKCFQQNDLESIACEQTCTKQLKCGHPCQNLCGEPCTEKCVFNVQKRKRDNCQHPFAGQCYLLYQDCKEPAFFKGKQLECSQFLLFNCICNRLLPCGHRCQLKASEDCQCKEVIKLPCCQTKTMCFLKSKHACRGDSGDEDFI